MSNDVKTKNDEEIRLFFSAGDRMMKGIDALRKKNAKRKCRNWNRKKKI